MVNSLIIFTLFVYFISFELLTVTPEIIIIFGFLILFITIRYVLGIQLTQGLTTYTNNIYTKLKEQFRKILKKNDGVPAHMAEHIHILAVQIIVLLNNIIRK
jgi:hypothetical protein